MHDFAASLARLGISPDAAIPEETQPCGALRWSLDARVGEVYCDGVWHYRKRQEPDPLAAFVRCEGAVQTDVRDRIAAERERLSGMLAILDREGGSGWVGFDTTEPTARAAYEALRRFAAGRPPSCGVFLAGGTGQGKTRLMLAAFFELLAAGVDARWLTAIRLRELFAELRDRDDRRRQEAQNEYGALRRAAVVFLDDVGLPDDSRFVGDFRERLKDLLDESRAVWAVSTNLDAAALSASPDVGGQNVSRLIRGAEVIKLSGADWRTRRARRIA